MILPFMDWTLIWKVSAVYWLIWKCFFPKKPDQNTVKHFKLSFDGRNIENLYFLWFRVRNNVGMVDYNILLLNAN